MRIDSKSTVTHVDGAALLDKLNERIERMASSTPRMLEPVIEVQPDPDDADARAGGDASPDKP